VTNNFWSLKLVTNEGSIHACSATHVFSLVDIKILAPSRY